jgi:hypothetical protein
VVGRWHVVTKIFHLPLVFHIFAKYVRAARTFGATTEWRIDVDDIVQPKQRTKARANFIRLANKRVSKAIKAIQLLGNLANQNSYEYDEKDVTKIFKAIQSEVDQARTKFSVREGSGSSVFSLE